MASCPSPVDGPILMYIWTSLIVLFWVIYFKKLDIDLKEDLLGAQTNLKEGVRGRHE